jgi:hypothetical protein
MRYAICFLLLTGCAQLDAAQSTIATQGAKANDEALESAEFVICRGISVGAWMRRYGSDLEKSRAWRVLCSEQIIVTPGG